MIQLKTEEEIEIIRESGVVLGKTHGEVAKNVKPGITTIELDRIAEEFINDHGGIPSFKGYGGFPGSLCISVNEQVVHGIPGDYVLKDGDVVSIDCGVLLNGFHSDSAYTYSIGNVDTEVLDLLSTTKASLEAGIKMAVEGNRLGDLGYVVQEFNESRGFSVVRELVGHGVGRHLHEKPEVANYGKRGKGIKLKEGMVIAIEPMINLGKRNIVQERDGWTIRTADRKASAHFEHTVAVGKKEADVLTTFKYIEEALKK